MNYLKINYLQRHYYLDLNGQEIYQKIINFNYLKIKFILNITMDLNFSDDEENTLPSNNIEELPPMSDDEEEREYIQNILSKTRDRDYSFSFNVEIKENKKKKKRNIKNKMKIKKNNY